MHGAMMCGHHGQSCMHAAVLLYSLVAALGYWVMQHAAKETANCVKRTGSVLGTVLVVIGLLGVLCGAASHVRKSLCKKSCCPMGGVEMKDAKDAPGAMDKAGMGKMHGRMCDMDHSKAAK